MRSVCLVLFAASIGCVLLCGADWPTQSGSPQREGWAKSEHILSKTTIGDLKILYKFEPESHSSLFLSAPIIDGNLITYKGFKEMLVFSANSTRVFSVDADLNKLIWESHLESGSNQTNAAGPCAVDSSAPVAMAGSSSATLHFAPSAPGAPPGVQRPRRSGYFPPLAESLYPLLPTTLTQLNAMYTVSGDGALHVINSSTGENLLPPTPFLPAGSAVTSLNFRDNVVYATTDGCGGKQSALYAVDLLSSDKRVVSFVAPRGGFAGTGGTSIASDGTIFVKVASAPDDKPGHAHEAVVALTPKDLKVKDYFSPPGKELGKNASLPGITPLVFAWHGKNLVIAGFSDGRVYLLSADSLGGSDHATALFETEPVASRSKGYDGNGLRGTFASWPDVDGDKRWFYAPVVGPKDSGILALRLNDNNGHPELEKVWTSSNMISPAPPVVANGLIFALSTGDSPRVAKKNGRPYTDAEKRAMTKPAVLYALDAISGGELYSSRDAISGPARWNGLAVANARIYFSGQDGRVYCFGLPKTQPQLAEQH